MTKAQFRQRAAWLQWILQKIQLWRIDRALARIEGIQGEIKTHKEETIAPLEGEYHALDEEGKMRAVLLGKPIAQAPSANPTGMVPNPTGRPRGLS